MILCVLEKKNHSGLLFCSPRQLLPFEKLLSNVLCFLSVSYSSIPEYESNQGRELGSAVKMEQTPSPWQGVGAELGARGSSGSNHSGLT